MSAPEFIHLKVHSEFSIIDGIVRIKPLMKKLQEHNMPAVALTDQSNLFAAVKFYKAAMSAGIKPIFGADLWLENEADEKNPYKVTTLCATNEAYHNLTLLVSLGYQQGQHLGVPIVKREWLLQHRAGLIILSAAREGDIGQALLANNFALAKEYLGFWQQYFPDHFYLELHRTNRSGEQDYCEKALRLAEENAIPVVATNDVRFLAQEDFEAHEARVCIHDSYILSDPKRPHHYAEQQYLRSTQEMQELFADIPEALQNTVEIAKRCNVNLTLGKSYLPNFPVPKGLTVEKFLAEESMRGLIKRLAAIKISIDSQEAVPYKQRLDEEIGVINQMGFPGYFLIVADFISWAKNNDVPVGPGRGSGAGSLVAYALGITDLDPLEYELLFERFLNPERVSMPDFDIDFCMEGRDRVIDYVAQKYGRESVSQIITFGTMAARAVVRDVGRVMGFGYGHIDKLAKLIPFEIGMTLKKALQVEELLRERYEQEDDTRQLIDLAMKLEGVARNAGKHAGGVVISPGKLTDFTGIYCEEGSEQIVTQFDKDDVESVGLVKFDFLGLRTLTIIKWAVDLVNAKNAKAGVEPINIETIPVDDEKTYQLLKECQTHAVFQLESRGMRDLIKRLQPDCFEEIIALVALFRPGPLQSGMVDDFIDRKHGRAKVQYPHPDLEPILKPTYGVILYQEQVMQIAQVLAGYTLGGADILRRAMGKKKPEEMAEQRAIFLKGSIANNIKADLANSIFDLMEKFAGYGFNRSHSAAYALVAYQTAWLKTHYPAALMAAVLSSDMDNTDKVVGMVNECKAMNLVVHVPDINSSDYQFDVNEKQEVVYGLGAIKGVGQAVIEGIVSERKAGGNYTDLFSFCQRLDAHKINRRVLEALIKSGAMDSFGAHRASLLGSVNKAISMAGRISRDKTNKQADLFGSLNVEVDYSKEYVDTLEWEIDQILFAEKEVLGWYLSGHPIERYRSELDHMTTAKICELKPTKDQVMVVAGLVSAMRTMNTKRGDRMAFITLDDNTATIELAVFSDVFLEHRDLLIKDQLIIVEGDVSVDEYSGGYKMSSRKIYDINQAREMYARGILLDLQSQNISQEFLQQLQSVLLPHCGGTCPIMVTYQNGNAKATVKMGNKWRVAPKDDLIESLKNIVGTDAVKVGY